MSRTIKEHYEHLKKQINEHLPNTVKLDKVFEDDFRKTFITFDYDNCVKNISTVLYEDFNKKFTHKIPPTLEEIEMFRKLTCITQDIPSYLIFSIIFIEISRGCIGYTRKYTKVYNHYKKTRSELNNLLKDIKEKKQEDLILEYIHSLKAGTDELCELILKLKENEMKNLEIIENLNLKLKNIEKNNDFSNFKKENEILNKKITGYLNTIDSQKFKIEKLNQLKEEYDLRITDLTNDLANLTKEFLNNDFLTENNEIVKLKNEIVSQYKNLEIEKNELINHISELKNINEKLKNDLSNLKFDKKFATFQLKILKMKKYLNLSKEYVNNLKENKKRQTTFFGFSLTNKFYSKIEKYFFYTKEEFDNVFLFINPKDKSLPRDIKKILLKLVSRLCKKLTSKSSLWFRNYLTIDHDNEKKDIYDKFYYTFINPLNDPDCFLSIKDYRKLNSKEKRQLLQKYYEDFDSEAKKSISLYDDDHIKIKQKYKSESDKSVIDFGKSEEIINKIKINIENYFSNKKIKLENKMNEILKKYAIFC